MKSFVRLVLLATVAAISVACDTDSIASPTAPIAAPSLTLAVEGPRVIEVGTTAQFQLIATQSGSSGALLDRVEWDSSDQFVLTNATNALNPTEIGSSFRGVKPGPATVIATYAGQTVRLEVMVVASSASPAPPAAPPAAPAPPASPPAEPGLESANGEYTIVSNANPDPCSGFPLNYEGTITIIGVRADGTGGSATLNRNGVGSPITVNITVRRNGSRIIIEFSGQLVFGGIYNYTMRWELDGLAAGATFTGTQALTGPCTSDSAVRGTKRR